MRAPLIAFVSLVAAVVHAEEEVLVELPAAASYRVSGVGLSVEDASGEKAAMPDQFVIASCGATLCAPLERGLPPLRLSAQGKLAINGRGLEGGIWILIGTNGLQLVNRLSLERYLVATVGSEMPKQFPLEALKAQAVAARTFALNRKLMRSGASAHLSASTLDQVYAGLAHESSETRAAVEATAGEVLVFDRRPIDAMFFSSCDGRTRDLASAFGQSSPYLQSVSCGGDGNEGRKRWRLHLTQAALGQKLGMPTTALKIAGYAKDGRPEAIVVEPSGKRFSAEGLRKALGYTALKSPSFTVTCDVDGCEFAGQGYGHGVGMCQWGARGMALQGTSYRDILGHYYPGAELKRLY